MDNEYQVLEQKLKEQLRKLVQNRKRQLIIEGVAIFEISPPLPGQKLVEPILSDWEGDIDGSSKALVTSMMIMDQTAEEVWDDMQSNFEEMDQTAEEVWDDMQSNFEEIVLQKKDYLLYLVPIKKAESVVSDEANKAENEEFYVMLVKAQTVNENSLGFVRSEIRKKIIAIRPLLYPDSTPKNTLRVVEPIKSNNDNAENKTALPDIDNNRNSKGRGGKREIDRY
ncbi:MAG: hypothetical protein AB4057_03845 [Crocosphaera sp.]